MYTAPQKKFSTKKIEEIQREIETAAILGPNTRRIFLADGDALALSTRRLLAILALIKQHFPNLQRVSSYCLPRNVKSKSIAELQELRDAGLSLVYVGAESGDDEILTLVDKGETFLSSVESLNKIRKANIKSSVMILNGLGGKLFSHQHALNSARLLNETQPHYLATLVVSFPLGMARFTKNFSGKFEMLDQTDLFCEMETMIKNTQLNKTIFRSDHASNYLVLKGILGRDKTKLLEKLQLAKQSPNKANLREEWERGL